MGTSGAAQQQSTATPVALSASVDVHTANRERKTTPVDPLAASLQAGGEGDSQGQKTPHGADKCCKPFLRSATPASPASRATSVRAERSDKAEVSGSSPLRPTPTAPSQADFHGCDSAYRADLGD
jgi:hypothetical protein